MRTEMSICRNKRIKAQNEHLSQLSPMAMLSFKTLTRTSAGTSDTHACSSIGPSPSRFCQAKQQPDRTMQNNKGPFTNDVN